MPESLGMWSGLLFAYVALWVASLRLPNLRRWYLRHRLSPHVPGLFVALLLLGGGCRTYLFSLHYVTSRSMLPALRVRDIILVQRWNPRAARCGDVVLIQGEGALYFKRLVAHGPSRVALRSGQVLVDGRPCPSLPAGGDDWQEHRVPPGYFFALGDYRARSADSRVLGDFSESALLGRAVWRVFPDWGTLDRTAPEGDGSSLP